MIDASQLPHCEIRGVYFRQTDYDTPFWALPNSVAGRWNTVHEAPTQYWAQSPEVAWAERMRQEEIRDKATAATLRTTLWVATFQELRIVDLTAGVPEGAGVTRADLTSQDYGPCQNLATELRASGVRGVLAPSAAIRGGTALTLFGPRVDIPWNEKPMLRGEVAATRVALGSPPPGIVVRVLHREE